MASEMFAEDEASWCCTFVLVTLLLLNSFEETNSMTMNEEEHDGKVMGRRLLERACDEIYVVAEGETLHSISDKCGDPFIVEHNPHIHDPDDVFPGLVIKITPPSSLSLTSFKR
ncbi:putative F-box and wd40 domain protein [Hibiscus syriacus]|uniref:F-box and wd40 domain protein n=2 Tax=Hibiscus syriacus TaxID=106335 RepID=A0A6A3BX20_HIBSY|nr:putative F-box and wd40 domain protein [Hibiscus syriacus]